MAFRSASSAAQVSYWTRRVELETVWPGTPSPSAGEQAAARGNSASRSRVERDMGSALREAKASKKRTTRKAEELRGVSGREPQKSEAINGSALAPYWQPPSPCTCTHFLPSFWIPNPPSMPQE